MPWWVSLILLSAATVRWGKSCNNSDDVIALLERIIGVTFVMVVLLVTRNLLLEGLALVGALRLPVVQQRSR